MWFFPWLLNPKRSGPGERPRTHPAPRRRATFRPRLEALEDRWLPSQIGLTVTSLADSGPGTLREAIATADAGSHSDKFKIGFTVSGTIDLQSPLPDLNNSIAIQGPGASSLTVEQATGASFTSAIVTVDFGQTASLAGLTIANGSAGGILSGGTLTLTNSAVKNNSGLNFGGGIYNQGTLTVSGCTLSGNSAFIGGGIFNESSLVVRDSVLMGNTAQLGGGIANENGSVATVTVSGSTLSGNFATAIVVNGRSIGGFGGGIWSEGSSGSITTVTVSDSTLSCNFATVGGGAIFQDTFLGPASVTITGSTLCGNTASKGAAIYNDLGTAVVVRGSSFSGNTAGDSGGGIYNLGAATLKDTTLSGNTAGSEGGGIFNGASGTLAVKDSTVLANTAALGADIYNLGALTLDDSTVGVIGP